MSLHLLDCLYGSWGGLSLTLVRFLSHRIHRFNRTFLVHAFVHWKFFFLTEHTEFTELFGARFEPTEGLRHTEVTEAFQLTLAVTLCEIG